MVSLERILLTMNFISSYLLIIIIIENICITGCLITSTKSRAFDQQCKIHIEMMQLISKENE